MSQAMRRLPMNANPVGTTSAQVRTTPRSLDLPAAALMHASLFVIVANNHADKIKVVITVYAREKIFD